MFENRHEPLISRRKYFGRLARSFALAIALAGAALMIGIAGYHFLEGLPWLDALLNASMILGGMGPVNALDTAAGKLFASCYALFSGLVFIVVSGVVLAPVAHRILHRFHLEHGSSEKR